MNSIWNCIGLFDLEVSICYFFTIAYDFYKLFTTIITYSYIKYYLTSYLNYHMFSFLTI